MQVIIVLSAFFAVICAQQRSPDADATLLKFEQDGVNPDGSYQFSYETSNGISADEAGQHKPGAGEEGTQEAQGSFKYTAPDGTPIALSYIANEEGFQPQGDHLPTPPPIPAAIQRSLEWNAAHPEPEQGAASNLQPVYRQQQKRY